VDEIARPAFAPIPAACKITGLGRSVLYEVMARGHIRAVKSGRRTLVDVQSALATSGTCRLRNSEPGQRTEPRRRCRGADVCRGGEAVGGMGFAASRDQRYDSVWPIRNSNRCRRSLAKPAPGIV
jgi:hypothetical protein